MFEARVPSSIWRFVLALLPLWLIAWWRLVTVSEHVLVANVLVDDALYFALPARHWWQGLEFSFDGVEPTNGVQTLWAIVVVGLAGICDDPTMLLRAMVGTSGLCWLGAAVGLYALLRRSSEPAALLAGVGFAWCGMHQRMAFQGMENGLQALLGVVVLLLGRRAVARGWTPAATLSVGAGLALFALGRTEGVLLGPIVGAPLLFGWLGGPPAFAQRLRRVLLLALPGVLLVGGACLCSRIWFGSFLPISGSVKQFYEANWRGADDPAFDQTGRRGMLAMVVWHFEFVWRIAISPLREQLPGLLHDVGLRLRIARNIGYALLGAGVVFGLVGWLRRRVVTTAGGGVAWCFGLYALVHVALIAVSLPHFSSYAIWYFSAEAIALWLLLGTLLRGIVWSRAWMRLLALVVAVALSVAGVVHGGGVTHDVRTSAFRRAGLWLREHTEPGTVIGALSSGLVGWYAEGRHVVNLDGLINNRRYLDDYLRPARVHDYFEDRGIEWFSDYAPLANWKGGIGWQGTVPPSRLVPRRYWRLDAATSYVVWRVLPAGATFELLADDGPAVRDRYAELAVAADVHERFPVVAHAQLEGELDARPDARVARSLAAGIDEVWHVLATPQQLEQIALTEHTVHPDHAERIEVAPGLVALGYDTAQFRRAERRVLALTVFWLRDRDAEPVAPRAVVRSGDVDVSVAFGARRGWLPPAQWPVGSVVAETVLVDVPPDGALRVGVGVGADTVRWFTR